MRKFLFLNSAQRFSDFALLLLRVFVGLALVWASWDNASAQGLHAYATFLERNGLFAPEILAPVIIYLVLCIGVAFVLGLFTRWAGIFCVITFSVAIAMVDRHGGMRSILQSGGLVVIGLYLATYGAGRFSVDAALRANDLPRSNGGVRFRS